MKLAIIGSRNFTDFHVLIDEMKKYDDVSLIVSGGAKGADSLGESYANRNNINTLIFLPDWKKYQRAAGFIRNKKIIDNCDVVLAFWDGKSKGTKNSIDLARKQNKLVDIVYI